MLKMPVLFIGHGSPMNIIAANDFTRSLNLLGKKLPTPKAILVVSAHWLTKGTHVCCAQNPKTIYDFYGFPRELYQISYPCPGAPEWAETAKSLITKATIILDDNWGLDHAAWAILHHIYPKADIPVLEMSLDHTKPPQYHYDLAQELAPLREQGILIIGSGNIVHNLSEIDMANMAAKPYAWAETFDAAVKSNLILGNHKSLVEYQQLPGSQLAVPTNEHYLPLLYAIALQSENDNLQFVYEEMQNASISMRSFIFQ
jgi:4,5-DOPA dioxygenase extradiol